MYKDDLEAAHQRIRALESECTQLRREAADAKFKRDRGSYIKEVWGLWKDLTRGFGRNLARLGVHLGSSFLFYIVVASIRSCDTSRGPGHESIDYGEMNRFHPYLFLVVISLNIIAASIIKLVD